MMGFDSRANYALSHSPEKLVHRKSFLLGSYFESRFYLSRTEAPVFIFGGDDGIRTHDPLLAGQVLSQLSYTPIF